MAQSKIKQLTHHIFDAAGIPSQISVQLIGFYRGIYILPTLAHRPKLWTGERLDVAGCSDAASRSLAMPQRSIEAKLDELLALCAEFVGSSSAALRKLMLHPLQQHPVKSLFLHADLETLR